MFWVGWICSLRLIIDGNWITFVKRMLNISKFLTKTLEISKSIYQNLNDGFKAAKTLSNPSNLPPQRISYKTKNFFLSFSYFAFYNVLCWNIFFSFEREFCYIIKLKRSLTWPFSSSLFVPLSLSLHKQFFCYSQSRNVLDPFKDTITDEVRL